MLAALPLLRLITLALVLLYAALRFADKARILWGLRRMRTAPGSLGVPLFGHTFALARAVGRYPCTWDLFSVWAQATAPEPVRVQIFMEQCAVIADPALMKRVLQTNLKNYGKDLEFSYSPFIDILGTGLVTSEGALWMKQRKLVSNAFRVEILDDIIGISLRAVERLCEKLERVRGTGKPFEIAEEFRRLTLQVIGEAILSLAPEESDRVFPHLYLPIMEEGNRRSLEPWRTYLPIPWFRHRSNVRQLNSYIIGMLQARWKRRQAGEKSAQPDMVDRIMDAIEPSEWGPAAEKQLCYEIKTFVLAGHETSAAMLTWSLFELSRNRDVEARVRKEAQSVFTDAKKVPTREQMDTMDYSLATLKEVLRLYSVVPVVTRVTVADDELGGVFIPAGTRIILSMQGVHHRADLWPEPRTFKAERFLPGTECDPFAYLAFIQGPRNCLGQNLALLESRVVLGVLTQRFKFKAAFPDTGRIDSKMIPIGPAGGMHMLVD